jgi:hypothetical protein
MRFKGKVTATPEVMAAIAEWWELGDQAEEIVGRYRPHMRGWFNEKTPAEIVSRFGDTNTVSVVRTASREPRRTAVKAQKSAAVDGDRPRLQDAVRRLGVALEWDADGDHRGAMQVVHDLRNEIADYLTQGIAA